MDKQVTEILDLLNEYYATIFEVKKISDIEWEETRHTGKEKLSKYNPYKKLSVSEFLVIYKIERMLEKGELEEREAFRLKRAYLCYLEMEKRLATYYLAKMDSEMSEEMFGHATFDQSGIDIDAYEKRANEYRSELAQYGLLEDYKVFKK